MKIQFAKLNKYNPKDYQNPHLRNNKFTFPKLHKCNLFTIKKYKSQHYKIQSTKAKNAKFKKIHTNLQRNQTMQNLRERCPEPLK